MNLLFSIAWSHLKGRLRQTLVAVLGVATGVGFSIAMAALMTGSQRDFIGRVIDATPHIVVRDEYRHPDPQPAELRFGAAAVRLEGQTPETELRGIRNPHARLAMLEDIPGAVAAPVLRGQVVVRYGGRDLSVSLVGIDPKREREVSTLERDLAAATLDDLRTAANGLIIGSGIARRLSARPGSTLTVVSPSGLVLPMKVVGVFDTGIVALDDREAYVLLKKAQVLLERPNVVNEIRLKLDDATAAGALARSIERRIGYKAESWQEANRNILEAFQIRNTIMYITVGSILVVAAFGIFNIVSTMTYEKSRDIAILKSMGFREGDIQRLFTVEGAVLGVAGTAVGWVLGFALFKVMGVIPFEIEMYTRVDRLPVVFDWGHYVLAGGSALAAATLAGFLPARRASRVDPVDILRGRT